MRDKTQKEMLQELSQAVSGIPDTEEDGLIGDIKDLVSEVRIQNGRIRKIELKVYWVWGILTGIGIALGLSLDKIVQVLANS